MIKKIFLISIPTFFVLYFLLSTKVQAIESSLQIHKVDQDKSFGYSLSIGDEFFKQKAFNWQLSYNNYNKVSINDLGDTSQAWAQADFDFTIKTVDLSIAYRHSPKSYNKFISSLMFEFQLGAAVNISEHKFVFRPDFDRDDVFFAEQGDINPVIAITLQKHLNKNSAVQVGIKHYPSYSDFGSISTLFMGVNYRFGRQVSY
jgi:hypothetical protein